LLTFAIPDLGLLFPNKRPRLLDSAGRFYKPHSPQHRQHLLRAHIEKLVPLTEAEFAVVLAWFSCRQVAKHDFLVREGELVKHNYLVVAGLLKLVHTDAAGKPHFLSFAMEDWWETDFQAYYTHPPAT
jgi:CRP-like cAMP-binding protein